MPQMNGYELCRAIKEQKETASIPVLLLAGTFEAFDGEEAKSVGADDSITKPFESGELIEKVKVLIGSAPSAPEVPVAPVQDASVSAPSPMPEPLPEPAPEPPGAVVSDGGQEPDIWDILSDVDEMQEPFSSPSDERSPGLGPLEDEAVVDVGSFDVGLDRPEPIPPPPETGPLAETGPPVFSPQPVSRREEEPHFTPQQPSPGPEPAVPPVETPPVVADTEKSQVENKEKDFFGFEIEGFETVGQEDLLGDAIEEITFDMETPAPHAGGGDPEASFVVPEPSGAVSPGKGETVSPETMGFNLAETPAPEPEPAAGPSALSGEAALETVEEVVEETPESVLPEIPLPTEPDSPDKEAFPETAAEPPVPVPPELPIPEPHMEVPAPEPLLETETGDLPVGRPEAAIGPNEAEIRKIIEEKVEKIAWEVVPELAEILIREAIEKLKGES